MGARDLSAATLECLRHWMCGPPGARITDLHDESRGALVVRERAFEGVDRGMGVLARRIAMRLKRYEEENSIRWQAEAGAGRAHPNRDRNRDMHGNAQGTR